MHASKIASRGVLPCSRSATSAKSIIMIAFFLTMPMSSTMPMIEITLRSMLEHEQREHRADARRRQRRDDRQRVDEALVEDAEHDVDREQRGEHEDRLGAQRVLERLQRAGEEAVDRRRRAELALASARSMRVASLSDELRGEVERHRDRREQPGVVDEQRRRVAVARRTASRAARVPMARAADGRYTSPSSGGRRVASARPRARRSSGSSCV